MNKELLTLIDSAKENELDALFKYATSELPKNIVLSELDKIDIYKYSYTEYKELIRKISEIAPGIFESKEAAQQPVSKTFPQFLEYMFGKNSYLDRVIPQSLSTMETNLKDFDSLYKDARDTMKEKLNKHLEAAETTKSPELINVLHNLYLMDKSKGIPNLFKDALEVEKLLSMPKVDKETRQQRKEDYQDYLDSKKRIEELPIEISSIVSSLNKILGTNFKEEDFKKMTPEKFSEFVRGKITETDNPRIKGRLQSLLFKLEGSVAPTKDKPVQSEPFLEKKIESIKGYIKNYVEDIKSARNQSFDYLNQYEKISKSSEDDPKVEQAKEYYKENFINTIVKGLFSIEMLYGGLHDLKMYAFKALKEKTPEGETPNEKDKAHIDSEKYFQLGNDRFEKEKLFIKDLIDDANSSSILEGYNLSTLIPKALSMLDTSIEFGTIDSNKDIDEERPMLAGLYKRYESYLSKGYNIEFLNKKDQSKQKLQQSKPSIPEDKIKQLGEQFGEGSDVQDDQQIEEEVPVEDEATQPAEEEFDTSDINWDEIIKKSNETLLFNLLKIAAETDDKIKALGEQFSETDTTEDPSLEDEPSDDTSEEKTKPEKEEKLPEDIEKKRKAVVTYLSKELSDIDKKYNDKFERFNTLLKAAVETMKVSFDNYKKIITPDMIKSVSEYWNQVRKDYMAQKGAYSVYDMIRYADDSTNSKYLEILNMCGDLLKAVNVGNIKFTKELVGPIVSFNEAYNRFKNDPYNQYGYLEDSIGTLLKIVPKSSISDAAKTELTNISKEILGSVKEFTPVRKNVDQEFVDKFKTKEKDTKTLVKDQKKVEEIKVKDKAEDVKKDFSKKIDDTKKDLENEESFKNPFDRLVSAFDDGVLQYPSTYLKTLRSEISSFFNSDMSYPAAWLIWKTFKMEPNFKTSGPDNVKLMRTNRSGSNDVIAPLVSYVNKLWEIHHVIKNMESQLVTKKPYKSYSTIKVEDGMVQVPPSFLVRK